MWTVMMVAMMLPSLVPMWTVFGLAAFPVGVALAEIEMRQPAVARAVPIAVGVVVLAAGALQFTAWKARYLACCREASGAESSLKRPPAAAAGPGRGGALPADAGTAWRHGLRLGLHCSCCCAGLMALLLVVGVMDLRAMAVVAAAITSERLAPAGARVARAIGAVVVGAGLFLIGRAAGSDKKRARRRARSRKRTWIVPAKQPHEVPPPSRYGFVVVLLTASSRTLSA
jgi:predicted metal-binding membrane protein